MSDIKPGDRVRCTLGESVVVGVVAARHALGSLTLHVGESFVGIDPSWAVEVLDPEPDNFPTEPALYEVTCPDGVVSPLKPWEVGADGRYRVTYPDGSQSNWYEPDEWHRRASWKRLLDPPPEPPEGTVLRDRDGDTWHHTTKGWHLGSTEYPKTWAHIQQYGPFTRFAPDPDPDDEQQVEALTRVLLSTMGPDGWAPGPTPQEHEWARHAARAALTFLRDGGVH